MRLSVVKGDPGFNPDTRRWKAFLDGKEVGLVLTADEEEGKIWHYVRDENGKIMLSENKKEFLTEVLEGKVEIRRID
jgi:hypothetical protein